MGWAWRHRAALAPLVAAAVAACGSAAAARAATRPTLSVKVVPQTVHPGQKYTITITGSFDKTQIRTTPYLLAFIDYTGSACRPTVGAEFALPPADLSSDFFPMHPRRGGILEPGPFKRTDHWKAGAFLGSRRVCAYLYRQRVPVTSKAAPLVTASATFKDVKR
jgi:hypothetical protein